MKSPGVGEHVVPARRSRRWTVVAGALVVALGIATFALVGTRGAGTSLQSSRAARPAATKPPSAPPTPAPNGAFTTASGATATIASLRGTPTMVWFVAGGCASCAASIPAVAAHFDQLRAAGVRVLTLGLYGDFAAGDKGVTQLLGFGKSAAGFARETITHPGWEWGMASESLSLAYDPAGIPDLYVLIGPTGGIRYRNSVPDSTMSELLAEAKRLGTRAHARAAVQPCWRARATAGRCRVPVRLVRGVLDKSVLIGELPPHLTTSRRPSA